MIILVLGGSGSGKSEFAENYIIRENKYSTCYYLATMMAGEDEETKNRIERHRKLRKDKGFVTVEQAFDIEKCICRIKPETAVLLEDLSNLLANEMFAREDRKAFEENKGDFDEKGLEGNCKSGKEYPVTERIEEGISKLNNHCGLLLIVSNNIFEDGIEYDDTTKEYIRSLAGLNKDIAAVADEVWEVVCGIPVPHKGEKKTQNETWVSAADGNI